MDPLFAIKTMAAKSGDMCGISEKKHYLLLVSLQNRIIIKLSPILIPSISKSETSSAKDMAFTVLVSGFLIIGVNYFLNMYMY